MERIDFFSPQQKRIQHCPVHGEYESINFFGKIWTRCPKCAEEERMLENKLKEEEARRQRRILWERKIGGAGIPERFKDKTLESFIAETPEQKRVLEIAKEYAENFSEVLRTGRCLIFTGRPGTGKTHLAIGIALHVMKENRTVLFTTTMRALRRIKDTWSNCSTETESQAVATFTTPDLLILDEVGVQSGSEFEKNIIFDIMNERYENCRPTIVLSNLTKDELIAFLGERVFDRLREDGGKVVGFTWESYRGKKKAK